MNKIKIPLSANAHYCTQLKTHLYLPNDAPGGYFQRAKKIAEDYLKKRLSPRKIEIIGSQIEIILSYFRFPLNLFIFLGLIGRKKYYPNNRLCIDITTICNLKCYNCQSSVRQAPANDHMTIGQLEKFVAEAMELKYYWNAIALFGGEPTLHPYFFEILGVLKRYKDFSPDCIISVVTNGAGTKVNEVLSKLPEWTTIICSGKSEGRVNFTFGSYNVAPIDTLTYRSFKEFSKGCWVISSCYGLELSTYGYYPSSPCMHVDRVFGFDLGIKKLSLVTEQALREQMKILCRYCGHFKEPHEMLNKEKISRTWKTAYEKYKISKPRLTGY
jgi:hypothetical protein